MRKVIIITKILLGTAGGQKVVKTVLARKRDAKAEQANTGQKLSEKEQKRGL